MKKFTFILLALISGTAFAQNSANGTAQVDANIVAPLSIESSGVLNFGTIAPKSTAQDVVLSPANVRTIPTGMEVAGNTTTSVPTFTVTREEGLTYKVVTASTDLSLEGSNDIIIKDIKTSLDGTTGRGDANFTVGGTLTIGADQDPGQYKGEVSVTVTYE
ncbi:MAG: DUF4402 domain-containing protein [Salegentibacter sp.]